MIPYKNLTFDKQMIVQYFILERIAQSNLERIHNSLMTGTFLCYVSPFNTRVHLIGYKPIKELPCNMLTQFIRNADPRTIEAYNKGELIEKAHTLCIDDRDWARSEFRYENKKMIKSLPLYKTISIVASHNPHGYKHTLSNGFVNKFLSYEDCDCTKYYFNVLERKDL